MLNKNTKKSKKGFTLTEVLVVVLIIGVISAIAYPVYTKSINKSRAVEAINLLEMVRNKQIANFARKGEYLPTFSNIGQLTSNPEAEVKTEGDAILTVNGKYELAMNNATNCMTAAYVPAKGKPATFTFSSSYEDAGLGCDGDVCKTFGNIVGSANSVCNCGTKTCSSPYVQNAKTCACDCPLACSDGGCHDKNPARTETKNCGYNNSGTQSRTCPESCSSECNTSWSSCSGQTCNEGTKPDTTQNCANCGQKTQSVTCENGSWKASGFGACVGSKTDTQACDSGYTGNKTRTCTNDVWGTWNTSTCTKDKTPCPAACPDGQKRSDNLFTEDGECCVPKTPCPAACQSGEERDSSVSYSEDGTCCKEKTCKESMGEWVSASYTVPTCPGANGTGNYTCDGTEQTCIDVKSEITSTSVRQTTERTIEPPSGIEDVWGGCYYEAAAANRQVAVRTDCQYISYKGNPAVAGCSDISAGYKQYLSEPQFWLTEDYRTISEYASPGEIKECPSGVTDGSGDVCRVICNLPYNDTKGCPEKTRCYQFHEYYNMSNCDSWSTGYGANGAMVGHATIFTCPKGGGASQCKFNILQCSLKYQKRDVTCCAK